MPPRARRRTNRETGGGLVEWDTDEPGEAGPGGARYKGGTIVLRNRALWLEELEEWYHLSLKAPPTKHGKSSVEAHVVLY